jgi:hypothetical protein
MAGPVSILFLIPPALPGRLSGGRKEIRVWGKA